MTRNEFEQFVDRCIAGEIGTSERYGILDGDEENQWNEGTYIYLENIALKCFKPIYSQGVEYRSGWLLIKQILSGEKSWFFSSALRLPSANGPLSIPAKAGWLWDLTHDSEWTTLRKLIAKYRETRSISPDIREKYWEMAYDETFESKTIIDLMKKIIYHNVALTWFEKDHKGVERFKPGLQLGEWADPLDYTEKLLRIIDFCEGKTFLIIAVNYLKGQPTISLVS